MNKLIKFKNNIQRKYGHFLCFKGSKIDKQGFKEKAYKDNFYRCKNCNAKFWIYSYKDKYNKKYKYCLISTTITTHNFYDVSNFDVIIISCNEVIIKNILE